METTTVSPKFQVVIPKKVREGMGLEPGQKLMVMEYGDRIEMIVIRLPGEMQGCLKGMDSVAEREEDRL